MNIIPLELPEVLLVQPKLFGDARGFFYESFNKQAFVDTTGIDVNFVQDNHSRSSKGVLRGLHAQLPPRAQGKLVRVVRGSIFDVVVDIRKNSITFGKWVGVEITEKNHYQLWIPPGFAHGFFVLSESADLLYKTTDYYIPELEFCIKWDDPDLAIDWPIASVAPLTSKKDTNGLKLSEITTKLDSIVLWKEHAY